jgi:hypothetical protein
VKSDYLDLLCRRIREALRNIEGHSIVAVSKPDEVRTRLTAGEVHSTSIVGVHTLGNDECFADELVLFPITCLGSVGDTQKNFYWCRNIPGNP